MAQRRSDRPGAPPTAWDPALVTDRLLALRNRRRIAEHVRANPGVHLRQVARDLGLALGTAEHHLRALVRHGVLEAEPARRRTAYFLRGQAAPEQRRLLAALRGAPQRRLLRAVLDGPGLDAAALARRAGLPAASAAYHLQRLIADGHLEALRVGRGRLFRARSPDLLAAVLRDGPGEGAAWMEGPASGAVDTEADPFPQAV